MRVLNVCVSDWANYSYDNAEALKSIGVDAKSYKMLPHPFKYENESALLKPAEMLEEIDKADVVQIMHTEPQMLEYCKQMNVPCVVYHTGSRYRSDPEKWNDVFNPYVKKVFTDQCEFMQLGGKDITYIATAVDTDKIPPVTPFFKVPNDIIFGHYPSKEDVKGTIEIKRMMDIVLKGSTAKFICSESSETVTGRVSHDEQLLRMACCDVYIELFKPELRGKPYGCFGVTAFEAAALGKVVVTQNIHEKVYEDAYGECALFLCNYEKAFINTVTALIKTPLIEGYQRNTRAWVVEKHSYKATGTRIKKLLEELL